MWRRPTTDEGLFTHANRTLVLGTYMRSAGSTLSSDPRTRPAHWRDPAHEPVHDHYPPMYGLGAHPALHNTTDLDLRLLLRAGGTWVIDHVYELITTGVDPDTGRPVPDPSTGRPLGRWTGVRWEDVAVALLRRAHGRFTSEGWAKDAGSPQDVDLDAPGGGAWPWERGGWAFERKPSRK